MSTSTTTFPAISRSHRACLLRAGPFLPFLLVLFGAAMGCDLLWEEPVPVPALVVDQGAFLQFAGQAVGCASAPEDVLLRNPGEAVLELEVGQLVSTADAFAVLDHVPGTRYQLEPGGALLLQVVFLPPRAGTLHGYLPIVPSNVPGGAIDYIPIEGEGIGDVDSDGFGAGCNDCDDDDPTAHPSALEICDGIDNDCDGDVDEGVECP